MYQSVNTLGLLFLSFLSMLIYFTKPLWRQKLGNQMCQVLVLTSLGFFLSFSPPLMAFFLYVSVEATSEVKGLSFRIYAGCTLIAFLLLTWIKLEALLLPTIIITVLIGVVLYQLGVSREEKQQKQLLYDELRGEYRSLKRMSLEADKAARNEERTRIARDIHDSVGHKLTALLLNIQVLKMSQELENVQLDQLKRLAEESLAETRHAVKELDKSTLQGVASIVHLIKKLESESHMNVSFTVKQRVLSLTLSNTQSVALYRAIQEGFTNAMRHGSSRELAITLMLSPVGDLSFQIKNSIAPDAPPFQEGFGLKALKQRIESIRGQVSYLQTPEHFSIEGIIKLN
ncbi:histidine kinase [Priestia flexa]|uniref:sensor histidine kinase n=1 Tax=Priestia flexa TaxID=86664 RepID=UPI002E1AE2A9|nr:histidine kinase [Priestia flexa]MED3824294.1 histidine kinase [Priestia flexa]